MPSFYFDIHENGVVQRDDEGIDLPDLDAARQEAIQAVKEGVADEAFEGRLVDVTTAYIEIRDASGNVVSKVAYPEVLGTSWPAPVSR